MVLTKEVGFTRQDVRGQTTIVGRMEEPSGFWPWLQRRLWFLSNPEPTVTREVQRTRGMTEKEAIRQLVMHDEHEEMKDEKRDEESETAQRKADSRQGLTGAGNVPASATTGKQGF